MVWAGIGLKGRTKLYFVKPGVKINAAYYIENILKPLVYSDLKRLYPNGEGILQQDSAPSHTANLTLKYLKEEKVKFIPPYKWTPNSPDNSPCDYFLWGELSRRVAKRKASTIEGLKKILQDEYDKIPQESINNAMKAWLKRCRLIYKYKGLQIENRM